MPNIERRSADKDNLRRVRYKQKVKSQSNNKSEKIERIKK